MNSEVITARLADACRRWVHHLRWWAHDLTLLLRRSVAEFQDDGCTHLAAGISYYVLLSLFPLAILVVSVSGLILQNDRLREQVTDHLFRTLPLSADEGRDDLERTIRGVATGFSTLGLLSVLGLVWSASGMMAAIRRALNEVWDVSYRRPLLRAKLIDLLMILGVGVLVTASFVITIFVQVARRVSSDLSAALGPFGAGTTLAFEVAVVLAAIALSFATFLFLFTVVPAVRTHVRHVWPGALVAALGFELVKNGFALYLRYFGSYDLVYGSLGAVIAFLFFIYVSANIMLFGAEMAAEWPRVMHGYYDQAALRLSPGEREPWRRRIWRGVRQLAVSEQPMPPDLDGVETERRRQRRRERDADAPPFPSEEDRP